MFEGEDLPGDRIFDERKVDQLVKKFRLVGCLRLEPSHFVSALIDVNTVGEALRMSNMDGAALLDRQNLPPQLSLAEHDFVQALDGKHRIAAAKRFLLSHDN
jgi:hypothetical protein